MLRWLDFLFPPRVDENALRNISPDEFLTFVAPRLAPVTRPGTVVLLPFSNQLVRSAIHEAKYRGSERAFTLLALALAEYLRDFDDENYGLRKSVIIVPVPLGKERRKERGFNQSEEISRRAIKELNITIDTTLLERTRETTSQVSLAREKREKNMRGAFKAIRPADTNNTYVLIDDVTTTGATLQAAIDALKEAGAENIIPLALAH
ncbi:MAG: phosphoribosyltransferase family protein [Candidatus Paceibacterota bacterium]|jgi:ComF family protein